MTEDERVAQFNSLAPTGYEFLGETLRLMGFFTSPASTKYHGNHEGGLWEHCWAMFCDLNRLTVSMGLKWSRSESPFLIAFLHDICKCDQYKKTDNGYEYRKDCLLTGHGEKSVMLCTQIGIELTEEEMACIRYHMGAFVEKEEWSYFTGAIHRYPNVLWTHTADMMASHIENT